MFSRKELADAQRNSKIFEEEDPNVIKSPNYKRTDRANAYRHALRQQIEDDEQSKQREKILSEEHPLEMKVQRHQLRHKVTPFDEGGGPNTFQIGNQENSTVESRRSAQAKYRAQLEADSARCKEMSHVDDPLLGRKPYSRNPVTEPDTWNIGKDEMLVKAQKKKEAKEFYQQEMLRNPVNSKLRNRPADEDSDHGGAFTIGRDELELKALKALQRQEYRDALDEQKVMDERRRLNQLQNERNEDRMLATTKLPYSQK